MAGGFPVGLQWAPVNDYVAASTTYGIAVASSVSANTKGSFVQLVAATSQDATWLEVFIRCATASSTLLVDIAVGGAGAEIVIIPNIMLFVTGTAPARALNIAVPCSIPAGSRISARCQAGASRTCQVGVRLFNDAMGSYQLPGVLIDAYNVNTATSLVTNSVDPGGSANTKGAYAELTSSTTSSYQGFFLAVGPGNSTTSSTTTPLWGLDIAIGAAGSEIVILPDQLLEAATTSSQASPIQPPALGYYPIPIPAGSRIAARAQCSATTANGRLLGVAFYGVR